MMRVAINTMALALVVAGAYSGGQTARRIRSPRNRAPTINSFWSSKPKIDYCQYVQGGNCVFSGSSVTLNVAATDQDNDKLTYNYSVSAGVVTGTGETVSWELNKAPSGIQTATVRVEDQRGGKTSSVVRVDVVVCGACHMPCPTIFVSCPSEVTQGDLAVFMARVPVDDPAGRLKYLWSHSNGRRFAGQAGPELRIEAIGSPGDAIKALVNIVGLDPSCSRQASCESRIVKRAVGSPEK